MPFFPPYSDSSVVLDLDFTLGSGVLTGTGFAVNGTGASWTTKGFVGNGTADIRNTSWTNRSALFAAQSGYVMLECERALFARDLTQSTTDFNDSVGLADSALHYAFWADNGSTSGDYYQINKETNGASKYLRNISGQAAFNILHDYLNSRTPQGVDPVFVKIIFTWSGTTHYLYVDGCCVGTATDASAPDADDFKRIVIGSKFGVSYCSTYAIKRLQIGTTYINPLASVGSKIALIGDSFVQEGCAVESVANLDSTTVAEIDGKQTALTVDATRYARLRRYRGVQNWGHIIQSRLLRETGIWHPIYNAGNSGNDWRSDLGANTQITQAHKDAVIATNPHVIIMPGSVNGILESAGTFDVYTDMIAFIDDFIDGCTNLNTIFIVQPFGWYNTANTSADSAQWLANYAEYSKQLAELDGYRDKCVYISHSWGAEPANKLLMGSNPSNTTASLNTDFHPSASGHIAIADILYPHIKAELSKIIYSIGLGTSTSDLMYEGLKAAGYRGTVGDMKYEYFRSLS